MTKCIIVENRINKSIELCFQSFLKCGADLTVLSSEDGGEAFNLFSSIYIHKSTNSYEFELVCFRRYFIISEFLRANSSVEDFILVDSDVIIAPGFVEHVSQLASGKSFVGSLVDEESHDLLMISPHVSFWTRQGLFDFVDFLLSTYTTEQGISNICNIENKFKTRKIRGGVTDMGLIYLWCRSKDSFSTLNAVKDGCVVDHNLNVAHNSLINEYKTIFGMKTVIFDEGDRYFLTSNGIRVRCLAVHFQGRAKILMPYFEKGAFIRFYIYSFALSIGRFMKNSIHKYKMLLANNAE